MHALGVVDARYLGLGERDLCEFGEHAIVLLLDGDVVTLLLLKASHLYFLLLLHQVLVAEAALPAGELHASLVEALSQTSRVVQTIVHRFDLLERLQA